MATAPMLVRSGWVAAGARQDCEEYRYRVGIVAGGPSSCRGADYNLVLSAVRDAAGSSRRIDEDAPETGVGDVTHTGQTVGIAFASHRAIPALTSIGFSCAIQCPDRITTSERLGQSRRIGSANREDSVSHV